MTETGDGRADATRRQILRAAAHQFAHKPYGLVNLDDVLAEAHVTKGAMYTYFRSKHALAVAVIDEQTRMALTAVNELLARGLSGVETMIDISFLIAAQDIGDPVARAGLHLLESIGRTDGLQSRVLGEWVEIFARIVNRAVAEGDIVDRVQPVDVARILVSVYMGYRQTCDMDEPEEFLAGIEDNWQLLLPGFADPKRVDYLTQFLGRRAMIAKRNAKQPPNRSIGELPDDEATR